MPTKLRSAPVLEVGTPSATSTFKQKALFIGQVTLFVVVVLQFIMMYRSFAMAAACGSLVDAGMMRRQSATPYGSSTSSLPDYYQTKPEL